ncbi:MAG: hypothetical protein A3H45_12720 [Ignavibacteria bacterium RIFCSPLOWO2_02_FULL_55_14]|nr:MAG: hypothetical protein A3H45_12720 [Ignavibacteria bacterium RIFCSPLOWO2_02_FULL_55_14]
MLPAEVVVHGFAQRPKVLTGKQRTQPLAYLKALRQIGKRAGLGGGKPIGRSPKRARTTGNLGESLTSKV